MNSHLSADIRKHGIRVRSTPTSSLDQFARRGYLSRSEKTLYHCDLLDLLVQKGRKVLIHVGAFTRQVGKSEPVRETMGVLNPAIRERLVIENDDRNYTFSECLQ